MGDVMSSYNGGMNSGPQGAGGIPRNNARVRPTLRKYESVGAMKPPLRDTKMQSTESAPSPDLESQEKVFKSRQGSFRRTFSLKSEKFLRRLQRGSSSSSSKLSLSESVGEEGSFEGSEKKPKGLTRVGTMPAMRLGGGGRRNTRDSDISEDSLSFRSDTDGSLWNVVKSRIGSFNFSRTNSQGSQSSIEALSPPILHGDADEQVDAVYQVLKQGAMLRASERTEEDPILARRQASLSAQNSLEVTENGSATQQSETTTTTNHVEASSSVTTTTSSSSSSTTKSMKVTSSSSSVVSKPPISNSKSKGSSSSSKTENYTIEYKQETAVGAATVTTEKKKGSFSSSGGGQQKQDFGDVVFKVMSGGGD